MQYKQASQGAGLTVYNRVSTQALYIHVMLRQHLDIKDLQMIRKATHYSHPVGDDRFKLKIEN